jgi:multidrug resistance efflux pump
MSGHHRTPAIMVAATILTLAWPVGAQVPSTSPSQQTAETVNLTMEQRHVIKELILKDMKITPPEGQVEKVPLRVGQSVPAGVPLQPMPVEVSAKVPQLKSHSFLVRDDKVVIIDPKDNKVAALID